MTVRNKLIILSILSFFLIEPVISQDLVFEEAKPQRENIKYPNIIKINSLALTLKNISLMYERGIIPRLSAGIGVGYRYSGTAPELLKADNSTINADFDNIKGFSITPEAKYYLRSCDPAQLEGFYAGLYLRYTGYATTVNFEYTPENRTAEYYNSDIASREFGVGLQLGYQLIIKERFSIDFLFIGPRFSSYQINYEFDPPPNQEFLDVLSKYLNEVVDRFGFDYNVNIQKKGETKASTSFSFANVRFGLSLGFAF